MKIIVINNNPINTTNMETLELFVDRNNKTVTTNGMTHSMKGNVDGTVNFIEAGLDGIDDKDEIEEYLIEKYSDRYDVSVIFEN